MAEVEVFSNSVGEFEEFSFVNSSWVVGVNSCTSLLNPGPVGFGWFVVIVLSNSFKGMLDFIVREGSVSVGVSHMESFIGLVVREASTLDLNFSKASWANVEVLGNSVGECEEFFLVNLSWVVGVNLFTLGSNPGPVSFGWFVVVFSSNKFKTFSDLTVVKGSITVLV